MSRSSIARQTAFRYIVGGYHHGYQRLMDLLYPGFVFIGLAADGIRWCNHIGVDALSLQRLVIHTIELWRDGVHLSPTDIILERLRPLCSPDQPGYPQGVPLPYTAFIVADDERGDVEMQYGRDTLPCGCPGHGRPAGLDERRRDDYSETFDGRAF